MKRGDVGCLMGPDDEASYSSPVDSLVPKGKEYSASTRA